MRGTLSKEHQNLVSIGDELFSKRSGIMTLWQELGENFYPERADFTRMHNLGDNYAANLDTSYPIMARRDLADSFGAMLRKPGTQWFHLSIKRDEGMDEPGRKWLAMAERVQTRALYDIDSNFVKATKEGDNDFATFGQCVLTSELAYHPLNGPILLHRCWHLRDVVWCEDAYGKIGHVQRKWEPSARELVDVFGKGRVHGDVLKLLEKEPYKKINVRHIRISASEYGKNGKYPYYSIFIDTDNQHVLEEVGIYNGMYIIPRWKTVSGSQYAYSPAAMAALPDARLLQAMTYTLLTAGEYAVEPALIGYPEAIKGAIEVFPGGFTALDASYDERLGEAIRPLTKMGDRSIPLGLEMNQDIRKMIADAFYLSKLGLPQAGQGGMSPYEIQARIEDFIRATLPLFEPMESEYNGALMEQDFEILMRAGAFGPMENLPESLAGQQTNFTFESPLRENMDRLKGHQLQEVQQMVAMTAQVDPMAVHMVNWEKALRGALRGVGTPADWMTDEQQLEQMKQAMQQQQQEAAQAQQIAGAAQVAQQVGDAGQSIRAALTPEQQAAPAQ
jgi:hypothetical protein